MLFSDLLIDDVSISTRLWTFYKMRAHLSWFNASPADLATCALLILPVPLFGLGRARAFWSAAAAHAYKRQGRGACAGQMVLQMNVEEAFSKLESFKREESRKDTPLVLLGAQLVKGKLRQNLAALFASDVLYNTEEIEEVQAAAADDRRKTIEAARSLGGSVSSLGELVDSVLQGADVDLSSPFFDESLAAEGSIDEDLKSILIAVVLYRRMFPMYVGGSKSLSILLSPPPSPRLGENTSKELGYKLRRALDSAVFETVDLALEDARDRVVDLIVEGERRGRS